MAETKKTTIEKVVEKKGLPDKVKVKNTGTRIYYGSGDPIKVGETGVVSKIEYQTIKTLVRVDG